MAHREDIDFRDELERHIDDPKVKILELPLLSGDKYKIQNVDELNLGKHVVTITRSGGKESFFPFEVVCNIDVSFEEE